MKCYPPGTKDPKTGKVPYGDKPEDERLQPEWPGKLSTPLAPASDDAPYLVVVDSKTADVEQSNLFARPVEVLVTDGKVTFPVKPEKATVMHLKKAIREYGMYQIAPFKIVVKDPATGKVMADEDRLDAGVKYMFELPT